MTLGALMMFKPTARTSAHFPTLNVIALAGVGLAGYAAYDRHAGPAAPVLALAGWIGFMLYAYWYSSFGGRKPSASLRVGFPLPAFTVKAADNRTVTSAEFVGKPAILIFFRGNWCPLCMAQIKELVGRYKDIEALGVRIALISPQPHVNTQDLAKKFGVAFDFLTDPGAKAARMLGINHSHGLPMGMQMLGYDSDTVLPTVIITDKDGKVMWTHETDNYRIRPEPDVYLEVLRHRGIA
jgi:peroxiredoxin